VGDSTGGAASTGLPEPAGGPAVEPGPTAAGTVAQGELEPEPVVVLGDLVTFDLLRRLSLRADRLCTRVGLQRRRLAR
jgi:hypothetical protein